MAYNAWTVTAFEQPTAAKWNILGANDASFNDGSGIADDKIIARHIDWASTGAGAGIWGEELGRTTLGAGADTISVTSLSARKYLTILLLGIPTGGTINATIRFNNDTGNNYARRDSDNGGADATTTSTSGGQLSAGSLQAVMHGVMQGINVAAQEKVFIGHAINGGTAGAANAPNRSERFFKWTNTADQITRVDAINTGSGDFAAGSELVVLGHN